MYNFILKNKAIRFVTVVCLFATLTVSCTKDFLVKDIKKQEVQVNAPADGLKTPNNAITFWWEELDGAEKYNLQIVTPSFDAVAQLVTDTNVVLNKFYKTLTPGTYQWRIKAYNNGGSTAYVTRTLTIDTTSNLQFATVNSVYPTTGFLTGANAINFSWLAVDKALTYDLKITNANNTVYALVPNIANTNYTYNFTAPTNLNLKWQVKANNAFSFSAYNPANTFTIDVQGPTASFITRPVYATTANALTDSLKWTRSPGADTKSDSIIITLDSTFASITYPSFKTYSTGLKISTLGLPSPSAPGNNYYWWRIYSIDSAKNVSPAPSAKFKFKLN
jgi:hypothetical protein